MLSQSVPTFDVNLAPEFAFTRYNSIFYSVDSFDKGYFELPEEEEVYHKIKFPFTRRFLAVRDRLQAEASRLKKYLPPLSVLPQSPYEDELNGIVNTVNSIISEAYDNDDSTKVNPITLKELYFMQTAYEANALCTSVVVQPKALENPLLIRTMDWDMPFLKAVTVNINYKLRGRTVYSGTTWLGFVGLFTGMRHGKDGFSISLNYRPMPVNFMSLTYKLIRFTKTTLMSNLIRDVLETGANYDGALERLTNTISFSPAYVTIAGSRKNEGAIITKGSISDKFVHVRSLASSPSPFLVQVNIDGCHFEKPVPANCPEQGDVFQSQKRYKLVTSSLSKSLNSKSWDRSQLWTMMSQYPINVPSMTIYATLMSPVDEVYESRRPK